MKHQGELFRKIIKSKGLNLKQVADARGVTRGAIDNVVRSEKLTRKILEPYAKVLNFDVNEFFDSVNISRLDTMPISDLPDIRESIPYGIYEELQRNHFALERSYVELSEKYFDMVVRFFPSAAKHRRNKAVSVD